MLDVPLRFLQNLRVVTTYVTFTAYRKLVALKLRTCSCEQSKSTISVYVKQAVFRGRHRDGNEEKAKAVSKLMLTETMVIYSMVFHTRVQATCIALQITGHVKNQLNNCHDRYHKTKKIHRTKNIMAKKEFKQFVFINCCTHWNSKITIIVDVFKLDIWY